MNPERLKILEQALEFPNVRTAVAALERLQSSIQLLYSLPSPALEMVKAYVVKHCVPKKGAAGHFSQCYLGLVDDAILRAKEKEAAADQVARAITGKDDKTSR